MRQPLTIIPVASGKGGVGKSLLSANLGIALARMGHATVVADLDLGSPNLHRLLGCGQNRRGVVDFMRTPGARLGDFLQATPWPHLKLLCGEESRGFAANPVYLQKLKLIRQLTELPARYLILDLGAGNGYDILDFFRIAHHGLLITSAEPSALGDLKAFLRQLSLRSLDRALRHHPECRRHFRKCLRSGEQTGLSTLCMHLMKHTPAATEQLRLACARYQPRLVLNMSEHPDALTRLDEIVRHAGDHLAMRCEPYGFIFHDTVVRRCIEAGIPLLEYDEHCIAAQCIMQLAQRVVHVWDRPQDDAGRALRNHTEKFHEYLQRDARPRHGRLIPGPLRQLLPGLFN